MSLCTKGRSEGSVLSVMKLVQRPLEENLEVEERREAVRHETSKGKEAVEDDKGDDHKHGREDGEVNK